MARISYKLIIVTFSIIFISCCTADENQLAVGLEMVAEGFTSPVGFVSPGDGTGRMFVVDQIGIIKVMNADKTIIDEPFLDLRGRMVPLRTGFDERGLLGLAFHPLFKENGRFFVFYVAPLRDEGPSDWDSTIRISMFNVSSEDPNKVDANTETVILEVDTPQFNHNAGSLEFGPDDGYLYISIGDGGGADDVDVGHAPGGNGQSTSTLLGKILRIDVDNTSDEMAYAIPPDNPFVNKEGFCPEIFAYGLRNPFRISFDSKGEHELFAGDVGQDLWEEVDIITSGGNFGWNIREGGHCFDPKNPSVSLLYCPELGAKGEPLIGPIVEYSHDLGLSVIGGYVYRGNALKELEGYYIFADWSDDFGMGNGKLFAAKPPKDGNEWTMQEIEVAASSSGRIDSFILAFGQDEAGELYLMTSESLGPTGVTGKIQKLVSAEAATS